MSESDQALMLASIATWKREQAALPVVAAVKVKRTHRKAVRPGCARCPAPRAIGSKRCCLACLERNRMEAREVRGYKGEKRGRKVITA